MKRYLLVGAALAVIASPAAARDRSFYFGIEAGPMFPKDSTIDIDVSGTTRELVRIDHNMGVDGDLIFGYDFGMFRAEFEGSHKWAKHNQYTLVQGNTVDGDGHTSGFTTMGGVGHS